MREVAGSNPVVPTTSIAQARAAAAEISEKKGRFSQLKMPHILICNDDGIHAEGLRALVDALRPTMTVSVVAPSGERSASAQALTLRQPIFCEKIAEREWSVDGTPADAMIVGTE